MADTDLSDDITLLALMLRDSKRQNSLYRPGPYWSDKSNVAAAEIKRCGLSDFRGKGNMIGASYADNLLVDRRLDLTGTIKNRIARVLLQIYPFKKLFDSQVRWTETFAQEAIRYASEIVGVSPRAKDILRAYKLPANTLRGGCLMKARTADSEVSIHYLKLLDQHDRIASRIDFHRARSVFEVGGGFGANIHILLENYKNIRKVL